jgi:hypothetical protein
MLNMYLHICLSFYIIIFIIFIIIIISQFMIYNL